MADEGALLAFEQTVYNPSKKEILLKVLAIATVVLPLLAVIGAMIYKGLNPIKVCIEEVKSPGSKLQWLVKTGALESLKAFIASPEFMQVSMRGDQSCASALKIAYSKLDTEILRLLLDAPQISELEMSEFNTLFPAEDITFDQLFENRKKALAVVMLLDTVDQHHGQGRVVSVANFIGNKHIEFLVLGLKARGYIYSCLWGCDLVDLAFNLRYLREKNGFSKQELIEEMIECVKEKDLSFTSREVQALEGLLAQWSAECGLGEDEAGAEALQGSVAALGKLREFIALAQSVMREEEL